MPRRSGPSMYQRACTNEPIGTSMKIIGVR
jgi:hypothetical protein